MPSPKKNPLDKIVPSSYSVSRRNKYKLRERAGELNLTASAIVEELITQFLIDTDPNQTRPTEPEQL